MNVLIVDNSILFRHMLIDIFSNSDAIVDVCDNASQAIIKLNSGQFDFICVSMHLEDNDGLSLAKNIRKKDNYKYIPIILFTSEESRDLYLNALSSGITEVFHKKHVKQLNNFIQRFSLQRKPLQGQILYVEDMLSQRQLLVEVFTSRGLKVDAFSSAEEAWESYLKYDYDIVVTDIVLEGNMTGKELINRIRRLDDEKGDVPILALTVFDDPSRRIELFYLGVSDYVIKPLIEDELIARVRNLIKGKQSNTESIRQRLRADAANKSKSEFLSYMSHELRTPLNAILGFSQLMMIDTVHPLVDSQKDNMNEIKQAGDHLLGLINDILDISKIESGNLDVDIVEFSLSEVIDGAVKQVRVLASKNHIGIQDYIIPKEVELIADPIRLHQVLINLLSNAIKYNKSFGSVQISLKTLNNNKIRIAIKDTGIGLSDEQQAKLFVPFNRVGSNAGVEGTGLGLVICRRLIEAMGGCIDFKSKEGKGTTFWIDLPVAL